MPEEEAIRMSAAGWVFLAVSWIAITSLMVFCITKVLRSGKRTEPDEGPRE